MARKAFSLQPHELQHVEQLQQEQQKLLAQFGALSLDLEAVRQQLTASQEKQRVLVAAAVMKNGIQNFTNARIEGKNLVCEVPDDPPQGDLKPALVNGPGGKVDGLAVAE